MLIVIAVTSLNFIRGGYDFYQKFIIKDNVIISPEGRDILRGISREYVMKELCPQLGLTVIEKNIEPYDVYTADEAFMTGTPFCMLPVTKLNGLPIGDGNVGSVFNSILQQWSKIQVLILQSKLIHGIRLMVQVLVMPQLHIVLSQKPSRL